MSKLKLKKRRALSRSDFRRRYKRNPGIILVEGDGHINVNKIEQAFPEVQERINYYEALIRGMEK